MSKKVIPSREHPLVQTANLMLELGPQWVTSLAAKELIGYLLEDYDDHTDAEFARAAARLIDAYSLQLK